MERPQSSEKFVNWVRPDIQNERSEIERTLREFVGIEPSTETVEQIIKTIEFSPVVELAEGEWEKLDNTESFHDVRVGSIEDVEEITEKHNKDLARGYQRNVSTIVEGFSSGREMETPVIMKNQKGETHLVSGNTRLMVARALGIRPKVIIAEFKQSSENFEGRVELLDTDSGAKRIMLDGEKVGVVALADHGQYYSVGFITIKKEFRARGIGEMVYKKIVSDLDKPLRSDAHISKLAEHFWIKLVNKGLAKKIGTIANGRGLFEWIK